MRRFVEEADRVGSPGTDRRKGSMRWRHAGVVYSMGHPRLLKMGIVLPPLLPPANAVVCRACSFACTRVFVRPLATCLGVVCST
jgi:hypothetical protein